MSKLHASAGTATGSSSSPRPLVTRGLRREQDKRKRRRLRVPPDTLVLGIDLARERQARLLVRRNDDYQARFYHLLYRADRPGHRDLSAYVAVMNSYLRTAHVLVTGRKLYLPRNERPTMGER